MVHCSVGAHSFRCSSGRRIFVGVVEFYRTESTVAFSREDEEVRWMSLVYSVARCHLPETNLACDHCTCTVVSRSEEWRSQRERELTLTLRFAVPGTKLSPYRDEHRV